MADVQLHDFGDRSDEFDIVVVESMTRVDRQSQRCGQMGGRSQSFELARARGAFGICERAGMQFDYRRSCPLRGLDLQVAGIDEQRHPDARRAESLARL